MAYLFDRPLTVNCTPAFSDELHDQVLLSGALWERLCLSSSGDSPVAVSISPATSCNSRRTLDSLLSWAILKQDNVLEERFFDEQTILRQGSMYTFEDVIPENAGSPPSTSEPYQFVLALAAPVLQGCARRQATRLIITSALARYDSVSHARADPPEDTPRSDPDSEAEESEDEGFEIDEAFLAGSILHSSSASSPLAVDDYVGNVNGHRSEVSRIHASEWSCEVRPLTAQVSAQWDDCAVYVRTCDLSRIGILSGDWAVARSGRGSSSRLVRVYAQDTQMEPNIAYAAPQLLHNILGGTPLHDTQTIYLRSSPFGSQQPTIPTARTMTIARVASPASTDRAYQRLFLRALQDYLRQERRIVKQGDVVTVTINTDEARRHDDPESSEESNGDDDSDTLVDTLSDGFDESNELVFFMVTNIEHNVIPSHGEVSSSDAYVGSTVGELGCWVNSAVTRIVQTGVEHSRVPDTAGYLGLPEYPSSLFGPDSAYEKLLALTAAALNRHAVDYQLQLSILLKGPRGVGKYTVAMQVARRLGIHLYELDCFDIIDDNVVKTEGTLRARFEQAAACSPCILLLRNIDAFSQTTQGMESGKEGNLSNALQECINSLQQTWSLTGYPVLVVATTSNPERVLPRIMSCLKHEIVYEAPGERERHEILTSLLHGYHLGPDVSVKDLAVQTAALVAADLADFVCRARRASVQRALRDTDQGEVDMFNAGIPIIAADFELALLESRASYSENIGAPKIPSVSWDDVGGLAHVKADILDTIQLPLEHPELFADGLKKRSGILLYGPPGTGKTLLAKAVATSCALNFFSVKGPELLNMYIGESEANVRRVFQRARDARPCVIFFDELDSVAPKRGNHGDSGGVMDRIVSQLLAELDGLSGGKAGADVFVIGATNRPDLLDSALLRPGRFDRMLYLGVSKTHAAQLNILQALTRKFRLHPDLKLEDIAEQCPFHYTGADFYALCADALLKAMSRKAEELEATIAELNKLPPDPQHPYPLTPQYYLAVMATTQETEVLVSQEDFETALRELVPSVSQAEMDHYAQIQQRFSTETINGS
ncbi:hypothetical protein IEO21_05830 [Rhodonia placenta]|uniref:Peroxisomal ATPase PEX6 n=1 Tax=Rhodonia placenta TaxID=104341 RepID=A0A8H7U1W1_9APHY|nr:hypothetical protein IEO21_05830 [Postia placenta]